MTNEEYIRELENLALQAKSLFNVEKLHEDDGFRKWRQKLTAILNAAEQYNYNVECDVTSRIFDVFPSYSESPTLNERKTAFNRDLKDTINEIETIIEHFNKFNKSKQKNIVKKNKENENHHVSIKGIQAPVWLIALCVFIFLGIILEQLYISKNPVDIWGLKLGNVNNTAASDITLFNAKADPTKDASAEMGSHKICFLTGNIDQNRKDDSAICNIKYDSGRWTLFAYGAECEAACLD